MVRSRTYIEGLPDVPAAHQRELRTANRIVNRTAMLLSAATKANVDWALENPADRGDEEQPCLFQYKDHGPIFKMPSILALQTEARARIVTFAQCRFGGEDATRQKYTQIMHTSGFDFSLGLLDGLLCNHPPGTHVPAGGQYKDGSWNSKAASAYPQSMNKFLGLALSAHAVYPEQTSALVPRDESGAKKGASAQPSVESKTTQLQGGQPSMPREVTGPPPVSQTPAYMSTAGRTWATRRVYTC